MSKQKSKVKTRKLKPDGRLNPQDIFNLTKVEEHAFRRAARDEEKQKKKDFQVGGEMDFTEDFKIGEAGLSLRYAKSLFPSLG